MPDFPCPGLVWQSWTVQKEGYEPQQNEDAHRVEPLGADAGATGLLLAVADGASEAIYASRWASALVAGVEPDWPTLSDADLGTRLQQVRGAFSPLDSLAEAPWYIRNKYQAEGSQATLLAATLTPCPDVPAFTLRAFAVGDPLLLLLRQDGETLSFPIQRADDFGLNPALISTRPQPRLQYQRTEATLSPGDLLLLSTDALGRWLLQCLEQGEPEQLRSLLEALLVPSRSNPSSPSATDFAQLVTTLRAPGSQPRLRNDDTTLILCRPVVHGESDPAHTRQTDHSKRQD
jgi:hypothetical protein